MKQKELEEAKKALVEEIMSLQKSIKDANLPLELGSEINKRIEDCITGHEVEDVVKALIMTAFGVSLIEVKDKKSRKEIMTHCDWFNTQAHIVSFAIGGSMLLANFIEEAEEDSNQ